MKPKTLYDPATTSNQTILVLKNEEEAASIMSLLSYLISNKQKLEKLIN